MNQKVKAIFKLRGNRDREELAHCAVLTVPVEEFSHVQYSALPSVSGSNRGENMDAHLQDCTIEEQRGVVRFLWAEGVKHVEIHRRVGSVWTEHHESTKGLGVGGKDYCT